MIARWRRLAMGTVTITGLGRQGWFIPYRYAATLKPPGANPPYVAVETLFQRYSGEMLDQLSAADNFADAFAAIAADKSPGAPRWNQGWFAPLDAAIAYAMVRQAKPGLVVEVGSGHSTRFLARAAQDGGLPTRIVAIDPAPRAAIAQLAPRVEARRHTIHAEPSGTVEALQPGDILFIDSSHIAMPGSDVDHLFNHLLPRLQAGVLVHIHDIFLPDDYPAGWSWRGYNEQLSVAPMLLGGSWKLRFASHYLASRHAGRVEASAVAGLPRHDQAIASSLWLEKT